MIRLEKKHFKMILTEKQQKKTASSPGKIDKFEYLAGEEILQHDEGRVIEQGKFTYSPLEIALQKQTKTTEDQGKSR